MNSVSQIYQQIIDDVIENVKDDFRKEGVSEMVLLELKKLWERKLYESGIVEGMMSQQDNFSSVGYEQQGTAKEFVIPFKNQLFQSNQNSLYVFLTFLTF